ncbi:hypothetical protein [Phenylobacterium sp.]|uniref:hypothetical protein n=1 Tax=Phenylobacterium sp. TaxID=1871053 RepID=UPI00374D1661
MNRSFDTEAFETSDIFAEEPKVFEDKMLTGRIRLDNTKFERCRFRRVVLVYDGGAPPLLRDCSFENASFEFAGAAGRTLSLLQAMGNPTSGLRDIVKASFPRIFGH